jgi:acetoacetyl-CoA synthetase
MGTGQQKPLWRPAADVLQTAEMARFMRWVGDRRGAPLAGYEELWRWSVQELEQLPVGVLRSDQLGAL